MMRKIQISVLIMILGFFAISIMQAYATSQSNVSIIATGTVSMAPLVSINLDTTKFVGTNNLSLGCMIDWQWYSWQNSAYRRQLVQDAGFKLVRVFDFRKTNPALMPCTYWDESTKTGEWDWTHVDALTQRIFEVGAEPLYCLSYARPSIQNYIPPGMTVNPETELPYPESYAAYCSEWVKHFKNVGLPVRFYEVFNEPFAYFGWTADYTKLGYFKDVWNACARAMRNVNPNIMLSFDFTTNRRVLDYWIQNGEDIDFLDAHKYDCNSNPGYDDQEMFKRAEERRFFSYPDNNFYGFDDARQLWFNSRGKILPSIISESNVNSACGDQGTDPRMAQMAGAVRTALVLRQGMLENIDYHVYYEFSSDPATATSGYGFGMINSATNKPWYSYFAQKLIGSNLGLNNLILETSSSSNDVRVIAWKNGLTLNILVICKVDESRVLRFNGVTGEVNYSWIDNSIPFTDASIQNSVINIEENLQVMGYIVMLLQKYS